MSHVNSKRAKRSKDSHGCCRIVSQYTGAGWGMSWTEKHRCRDPISVFIIYNSMNGEAATYPGKQGKHKNEVIHEIQNSMITETQDLEFLGDNVKDTTVTIRSWEFPGHVKVHNALRLFIFASLYPHVRACAPPFSPLKRRFFLDCIISSTRLSEWAPS